MELDDERKQPAGRSRRKMRLGFDIAIASPFHAHLYVHPRDPITRVTTRILALDPALEGFMSGISGRLSSPAPAWWDPIEMGTWGNRFNPWTWARFRDRTPPHSRVPLEIVYNYIVVRFGGVKTMAVGLQETLMDLEERIVLVGGDGEDDESWDVVTGVAGDAEMDKPGWWEESMMGRWGEVLTQATWAAVIGVMARRGVRDLNLGFVTAPVVL